MAGLKDRQLGRRQSTLQYSIIYRTLVNSQQQISAVEDMAFNDKFDPEDYYFSEEGYIVFTEKYHLKRGYCCQSGCRHCPWKFRNDPKNKTTKK
jgi:hypothetical protein